MNKNKSRTSREKKPNNDMADMVKLLAAYTGLVIALTEFARVVLPFLTH